MSVQTNPRTARTDDPTTDLPRAAETIADRDQYWSESLAEMIDHVADEVGRSDLRLGAPDCRRLAARIVTRLSQEYGGGGGYFPKPDSIMRVLRDIEIWSVYDGSMRGKNGVYALAARYRLSNNQIWGIVRRQRALHGTQP